MYAKIIISLSHNEASHPKQEILPKSIRKVFKNTTNKTSTKLFLRSQQPQINTIMNILLFLCCCKQHALAASSIQPRCQSIDESTLFGKRGELNVRNAMYPRLRPTNRMEFKVKAPDAKKVQIDLGRKYDLVRNAEGEWSGAAPPTRWLRASTTISSSPTVWPRPTPLPANLSTDAQMTSGVEIPYPDGDTRFYMANVPHGDIRMKRYFSTTANDCAACSFTVRPATI